MKRIKNLGFDFLRTHPEMESVLNLDNNHCIVDKDELYMIYEFLNTNDWLLEHIGGDPIDPPTNIYIRKLDI